MVTAGTVVEPVGDHNGAAATTADDGSAGPDAEAPPEVLAADLDWRSVVIFLVAFVALAALTGLVRGATRTLTWITVGALLAFALDPLVSKLKRYVGGHRAIAVALVLVGFLAAVVALLALFGPPAVNQARDLGSDLPGVVEDLGNLPIVGDRLIQAGVPEKVEQFLDALPERLAGDTTPIERVGQSLLGGLLAGITTLLVAITLLLDGENLMSRARRLVPVDMREQADRIGRLAYRVIGQYFAGSVLVAGIAGIATTIAGLVLGVPLAPLAGAWVSMTNLVPQIGGAAGGIPFVLLGLTQGAGTGVACAVYFLTYQQFENNILSPLVVGRSVDLSPPATMTAALIGVSAGGVVGALIAVPLLGAAKAVYLEMRPDVSEPVVGDETAEPFRSAKDPDRKRSRRSWWRRRRRPKEPEKTAGSGRRGLR